MVGGSKAIDHLSFMFSSSQDLPIRIEEINHQLKEIMIQTKGLGLSEHVMPQQEVLFKNRLARQSWRESTSLLCEPFFYGRETKALGGLLRTKVEESEWEEMLNDDALCMRESRVLQVLELSYHDLPSYLKRCFAYCSIFPYNHLFKEEDVILLWMAEGFLPENVENKQMEDIGHEYFHDLVLRSFFEPSSKGSEYYKMHNLQSDLARKVAGDLCLIVNEVDEMPLRIGDLTKLQTLQTFIVGANAPIIRQLKYLKQLKGKLAITGLENVVSSDDAGNAMLHEKTGLDELEMAWEWGTFTNGIDDNNKIDVLEQLKPNKSTKVLTLRNYKGVTFPSWLGDPSFTKMVVIKLVGCERCESLPPLGKLPFLKELVVQEMRGLKIIDHHFYGGVVCSNPFPTLRTLKFKSMPSLESWLQSSGNIKGFSCLQELSIKDCPSLSQSLPSYLPMLQVLEIQHCKQLIALFPCVPILQKLIVEDCSSLIMVDQLPMTLQQMVISSCCKLQFVEFKEPYSYDGEKILLEALEVVNCQSLLTLLRLEKTKENISSYELSLFQEGLCPSIISNLTKLTISDCFHLISFPKDLVLPSLRNLLISVCQNLEGLPNQIQAFTSLKDLILTIAQKSIVFQKAVYP
ncbi:putative disease resistance RPP13-like protein 1 [Bienertia sinuspersici]